MVTITLYCPHCESDALVRNGHASNGKHLSRCHACGRQSRGVSRTTVSRWIKKKEFSFLLSVQPWSSPTQQIPLPRRWNWTNGWLVCVQKSTRLLDGDGLVPQEAAGGRLRGG